MIPAEALGCWNVAARDQSKEFFNTIDTKRTFPSGDSSADGCPNSAIAKC
jgi:hypothetical protein